MKELWAWLFSGTVKEAEDIATKAIENGLPPRPFSDFPNPFRTDLLHARLSVNKLVAYSFKAFEAWTRECGYGRGPKQTPYEFVGQNQRHSHKTLLTIRIAIATCHLVKVKQ